MDGRGGASTVQGDERAGARANEADEKVNLPVRRQVRQPAPRRHAVQEEASMSLPGQLNPSPRLLLGPGPSDVHPRVLTVMATPLMGHLDPHFLILMNETQ